jgi:hypothetical protein
VLKIFAFWHTNDVRLVVTSRKYIMNCLIYDVQFPGRDSNRCHLNSKQKCCYIMNLRLLHISDLEFRHFRFNWTFKTIFSLPSLFRNYKIRLMTSPRCLCVCVTLLRTFEFHVTWRLKSEIVEQEQKAVARQRLGEYFPAARNTHATIVELLDAVFSMQSVSYQILNM